MRDLAVHLDDSPMLGRAIEQLHGELHGRGIRMRPHAWLSHDWFSPEHVPGIAIPFYLAHPRLMRLERTRMLEVEGGSAAECLKILRHECGHAIQHGFRLHRRRDWQRVFGLSSKPYPEVYRPNPASRKFVQHLRLYYAQSHPDEDFAETFAVWLQRPERWRDEYAGWPALRKLEYVDGLMREIAGARPPVQSRRQVDPLSTLNTTLKAYYEEKQHAYGRQYPRVSDHDLRRVFSTAPRHGSRELATAFLRRNRARIRTVVARWTGEYPFTLDCALREMHARCDASGARVAQEENKVLLDLASLITSRTIHFHYSSHNRVPL